MNWRTWIFPKLQSVMTSLGFSASSVFAGGALTASPAARPFLVYRLQEDVPRVHDDGKAIRNARSLEVWAYDNAGSYDRIDDLLETCRLQLVGQVAVSGGIACEWVSNGSELADDEMKAIVRVGSYKLIGVSAS